MSRWNHDENPYDDSIGAVFDLGDHDLHGRIILEQGEFPYASTTSVFEDKLISIPPGSDLHGISERGRVSLLSCYNGNGLLVSDEGKRPVVSEGGLTSISIRSEYAVFGNECLDRHDPVIRGMRFAFEDFHTMLDHASLAPAAFGSIVDPDPNIIKTIEEHGPSHAPSMRDHDNPLIFYFTGKYEILPTVNTVLGSISALRDLHVTMSAGTNANDAPYVNIDFDDEPVTLDGAVAKMNTMRQFFAWIVGYAPKWKDVRVFKGRRLNDAYHRVNDNGNPDSGFNVFTSDFGGTTSQQATPSGGHTLISPSRQPGHFMDVMKTWLERNNERAHANRTFFASARGMFTTVIEDRMCAAANIFDQLPVADRPHKKAKMLDVARFRYQKVIRRHLDLPRMADVVESAVSCRNHITHGMATGNTHGVDYSDLRAVTFLTDALRFAYGVSELLECGWDMKQWQQLPLKWHHPFGRFIESYDETLGAVMPQNH